MAKIVGGLVTDFRGKLGGVVGSRNKSGPIVRAYTKGTNPNTFAQVRARSSFAVGASAWNTLTSVARNTWNSFALNGFVPKHGENVGQFSGYNACTALYRTCQQSIVNQRPWTVGRNGGALTGTFSPRPLVFSVGAPNAGITNKLVLDGGVTFFQPTFNLISATNFGGIKFELDLTNSVGTGQNFEAGPLNTNGIQAGFAFYMSESKLTPGGAYKNPERYNLGYFFGDYSDPTDWTGIETLDVETPSSFLDPDMYNALPIIGHYVRVTAYMITQDGQQALLGAGEVQVTATL